MDRDCNNCVRHTADGCTLWVCDFISRKDAINAYNDKEKILQIAWETLPEEWYQKLEERIKEL